MCRCLVYMCYLDYSVVLSRLKNFLYRQMVNSSVVFFLDFDKFIFMVLYQMIMIPFIVPSATAMSIFIT